MRPISSSRSICNTFSHSSYLPLPPGYLTVFQSFQNSFQIPGFRYTLISVGWIMQIPAIFDKGALPEFDHTCKHIKINIYYSKFHLIKLSGNGLALNLSTHTRQWFIIFNYIVGQYHKLQLPLYSTGHRQRQNETRLLPHQTRLLLKCKRGRGL